MINFEEKKMHCKDCEKKSELFEYMSKSDIDLINNNKFEVRYKEGEIIFKQGTFTNHAVCLQGGLAKIYIEGYKNKNLIISYLKPGKLLISPGAYFDSRHHYSSIALEDTTICHVKLDTVKTLIRKNKKVSDKIMEEESSNTICYFEKLITLTQTSIHCRMAGAIIFLYKEIFNDFPYDMKITRSDLADLTAMTRDSAGKVLKDFQKAKIIKISGTIITILDLDKLVEIQTSESLSD